MRAGDLLEVKRFLRTGIEAWLKVQVVAALGERVRKLCNEGPDLLLDDGTDAGTRLELKAGTNFDRGYFLQPLTKYGAPCLFLGDGARPMNKMYEQRNPELIFMNAHVIHDRLRGDPRFRELMRKIGFTQAQIDAADALAGKQG